MYNCRHCSTDAQSEAQGHMKVPTFIPSNPELWFCLLEVAFKAAGITQDSIQLNYALSGLDQRYLLGIQDEFKYATQSYRRLRDVVLTNLFIIQSTLLKNELLGERKPSQFFDHLRSLVSPEFPKHRLQKLWIEQLPKSIQEALADQSKLGLGEKLKIADSMFEDYKSTTTNKQQSLLVTVVNGPANKETGRCEEPCNSNSKDNEKDNGTCTISSLAVSSLLERVDVKVPAFIPSDPELWLSLLEIAFDTAGIKQDSIKLSYALSGLDQRYLLGMRDTIGTPQTWTYMQLKSYILDHFLSIQRNLLEEELRGERKPSEFLNHLRRLAGAKFPENDLQELWLKRMPKDTQAALASQQNLTLGEQTETADSMFESYNSFNNVASALATINQRLEYMESLLASVLKEPATKEAGRCEEPYKLNSSKEDEKDISNSVASSSGTSSSLERRDMKIPKFISSNPKQWFSKLEDAFNVAGITEDQLKFSYALIGVDQLYRDSITKPPSYLQLKREILGRFLSVQEEKYRLFLFGNTSPKFT